MNLAHHKGLTAERWARMAFCERLANVGSEVHRAISWRDRNPDFSRKALERALDLAAAGGLPLAARYAILVQQPAETRTPSPGRQAAASTRSAGLRRSPWPSGARWRCPLTPDSCALIEAG